MQKIRTHIENPCAVSRSGIFLRVARRRRCLVLTGLLLLFSVLTPYPVKATEVRDPLGRRVSLPENLARIVALAPNITEIVFALDQGHRLVGTVQFSNFPSQARNLPRVGSYIHPDLERIVTLRPDLCIAIKDGNPKAVIDRLESLGISVFAVDPRDLNSVMDSILAIGNLLGAGQKAIGIVQGMKARVDRIRSRLMENQIRPGVFLQIDITPIVSVGASTFIHELIETAGGRNLAAGPVAYPRFSREQVLALGPDVIIITSMARGGAFEKVKAEWGRWPELPAVRHNRIHLVDSDILDRPGPRMTDALEHLFQLIHPELNKDETHSPTAGKDRH